MFVYNRNGLGTDFAGEELEAHAHLQQLQLQHLPKLVST